MAGSVNKVILVGNVGKDPEVRTFGNGGKVANFSIATSESWKDKTLLDSRNSQGGGGYGQSGGGYGQDNMGQGGGGSYGGGGNVTQGRSQSASMQEGPAESFDLDDEIPF